MGVLYDRFRLVALEHPGKQALVAESGIYSYAELLQRVEQWAVCIRSQIEDRPRVGLLCEDPVNTTCISIALAKIDACCIPVNTQLTKRQLSFFSNSISY